MRVAIYTDYAYHRIGSEVYAERAFAVFLARLAPFLDRCVVVGRVTEEGSRARYPLGERIEFVPLPFYARLSSPLPVAKALVGSLRAFSRVLDEVDCVWLLGPHPFAFAFAALARARGKRVVLGVRQDLPEYVRNRHPDNRLIGLAGALLEHGFRLLGRTCSTIAVGPQLAANYRRSRRVLQLTVSLVDEADIVDPADRADDFSGVREVLSVGRLDSEKNPLLMADVLAGLERAEPGRWRLVICGEGRLEGELRERLATLGVADRADLRGYLAHDQLAATYASAQLLLHVSWTEGLPQVLYEAFAAALPAVATDVGGIGAAVGDAVTLIPPGDPDRAIAALRELAESPELRRRRTETGHALVSEATIEAECRRVAEFLAAP
jgi:glycosyltransferase involved in cell wall biosynthesis